MPKNYQEALTMFEQHKDEKDPIVYEYYKSLFQHELKEFDDYFTKWEVNRIY